MRCHLQGPGERRGIRSPPSLSSRSLMIRCTPSQDSRWRRGPRRRCLPTRLRRRWPSLRGTPSEHDADELEAAGQGRGSHLKSFFVCLFVSLTRKTRQTSSKRASGSGGNAGNPERSSPPVGQCPGSSALDPGRLCRDCGAPRTVPRLGPRMRKGAPWCLTKSAPRPLGQPLGWDQDAEVCPLVPNQVCLPTLGVTLGGDRTPRASPLGWDLGCGRVPPGA